MGRRTLPHQLLVKCDQRCGCGIVSVLGGVSVTVDLLTSRAHAEAQAAAAGKQAQ
jgi:hypothetical protein